jgi:hypothetical protein
MLAFEERVDVQAECELDSLTRRARRGDDDHAAGWRVRGDERAVVGRERAVLNLSSHGLAGCKDEAVAGGRVNSGGDGSSNLAPYESRRTESCGGVPVVLSPRLRTIRLDRLGIRVRRLCGHWRRLIRRLARGCRRFLQRLDDREPRIRGTRLVVEDHAPIPGLIAHGTRAIRRRRLL